MVNVTLLPEKEIGEFDLEICPLKRPDGSVTVAVRIFAADNALSYNAQFTIVAPYTVAQFSQDLQQLTTGMKPSSAPRLNVVVHRFILANPDKIYQL